MDIQPSSGIPASEALMLIALHLAENIVDGSG